MNRIIRPFFSITAALCVGIMSALSMGGCSDFAFNPIGKWKLTGDRVYMDNKLYSEEKPGYLYMDAGEGKDRSYRKEDLRCGRRGLPGQDLQADRRSGIHGLRQPAGVHRQDSILPVRRPAETGTSVRV